MRMRHGAADGHFAALPSRESVLGHFLRCTDLSAEMYRPIAIDVHIYFRNTFQLLRTTATAAIGASAYARRMELHQWETDMRAAVPTVKIR